MSDTQSTASSPEGPVFHLVSEPEPKTKGKAVSKAKASKAKASKAKAAKSDAGDVTVKKPKAKASKSDAGDVTVKKPKAKASKSDDGDVVATKPARKRKNGVTDDVAEKPKASRKKKVTKDEATDDEAVDGAEKKKRKRRKKDPNAPKQPATSYIMFCQSRRANLKEANPDWDICRIASELGAEWSALTPEDKEPWQAQYKAAKVVYEVKKTEYQATLAAELAQGASDESA